MVDVNSDWLVPAGTSEAPDEDGAEAQTPEPVAEVVPEPDAAPQAEEPQTEWAIDSDAAAVATQPAGVEEAASWTGWKVDGLDTSNVGRAEGVIVDLEDGSPAWLLVRMGRFGHFSAIPFALAAPGVGRLWVPFDRDTLRAAPRVDAGSPFTREGELSLCDFFGIPHNQGRAAKIVTRAEGSETARLLSAS